MQDKLLLRGRPLHMLTRYATIGVFLQCILTHLVWAGSSHAQSIYDVNIEVIVADKELKDVFEIIEGRTDYRFVYSNDKVDLSQRITIAADLKTLGAILDFIGKEKSLAFREVNANILVKAVEKRSPVYGAIRGRVLDSQTDEVLPGASVIIQGTSFSTTSDVNGEFVLRLPNGRHEVEVRYIGFKSFAQPVDIQNEATTELIFRLVSDVTELQDVVITGALQGQQRALNQQKTADNIKNVVSADQIGRFPDPNVAEALQRVPGVNIERDQGEGRYVLVRGLAPQFTNININGEQIPSPEAGVRYVALDAIPADQLASIEVSKALTPDMDGDAIGGSVNLITRRAQSEQLDISASALAGYNELSGRANLQGAIEVSKRFFGERLGIMLNSSYYETDRGSDNWERDGDDLELRDYELLRTRLGLSSTIDYRLNEKNEFYFRTIFNRFTDREWRRRYVFVPNVDDSPFEEHEIERLTKDRLEKQIVSSFNLGARHTFQSFTLDYEVAYADAYQDTPFDIEVASVAEVNDLRIDFHSDPKFPRFTVNDLPHTAGENGYLDNSIYEFDEFTVGNTYAEDINKTVKLNIGIPIQLGTSKGLIQAGGKLRLKEKRYDVNENVFGWTGGDVLFSGFEAGDYTLEKYAGGTVDNSFLGKRYQIRSNADVNRVVNHFNANINGYELNVEDKLAAEAMEAYKASEDVYAAYSMAKLQFGKLMILGGVRYEATKVSYSSQEVVYDFEGELQEIIPVTGSTDYGFILPQLHLKYSLDNNTNLRFAATRSYARPNFESIVPSQEIELNAREGTIGNPQLSPVSAINLDFMVDHYFGTVGILSVGVFHKQLSEFIFNRRFTTTHYPGVEGIELTLTQAQNGQDAELTGLEFAYQQNLSFLPGFLKRVNIYANYTFTTSKAHIQSRQSLEGVEEVRLPGQSRHVGNFAIGYDWKRFNVKLSANFNGQYLSEIGSEASEDVYISDRMQLDATASYSINKRFRIFTEFINITNQPFEVYQGSENRYIQREFYSWWSRIGLKFDW